MKIKTTKDRRKRIALRQRKRISGTAERPRLRVFRSVSHIYAQVIDDMSGHDAGVGGEHRAGAEDACSTGTTRGGNIAGAKALGKTIAERLDGQGHQARRVRSRRLPVSRPDQAVADAAREAGLEF